MDDLKTYVFVEVPEFWAVSSFGNLGVFSSSDSNDL